MSVKIRDALLLLCLSVCFLPSVGAVDVIDSQEYIRLTLERDAYFEFPLMLQNVNEVTTVKSSGKIDGWIAFWGKEEHEYDIYPGQSYVLVTVSVPEKADLGEYYGEIKTGDTVLSKIRVKVTLELNEVMSHETLSDVDKEMGTLRDKVEELTDTVSELRQNVATLEYNVSEKMEDIYEYQKDLDALEKEKSSLEKSHEKLAGDYGELQEKYSEAAASNEELNALTGALVGVHLPGAIVGGIILGVLLVATIIRREQVKRRLKKRIKRVIGKSDARDEFRYSFKR
jgi:hypothetical protein